MTKFNSVNSRNTTSNTWVIHSEQTLAAAATSVTISGLNGDVDHEYRVITRIVAGANSSTHSIKFNNDGGNNYGWQRVLGMSTTASAIRTTTGLAPISSCDSSSQIAFSDGVISAKSGYLRTMLNKASRSISGTTVTDIGSYGLVWTNTADNLTSLVISSDKTNGLGIGTYILVLKKVESTTTANAYNSVEVPMGKLTADTFCTIKEGTLGSAATTVALSGLDGDTDVIYELEWYVYGGATNQTNFLYFNADQTSGNYGDQRLIGNSTTISANRASTAVALRLNIQATTNGWSLIKALIYAKTGYLRTVISNSADSDSGGTTVTQTSLIGSSYTNTATNITSITLKSDTSNGIGANSFYRLTTLKRKV